jgi:hypothetical protein
VAEGGQGGDKLFQFGGASVDEGGYGGNGLGGGLFIAADIVFAAPATVT